MRPANQTMLTWAIALSWVACAGTPIPQPPPENLVVDRIVFPEVQPTTNQLGFIGEPGAAPPNSTLLITNLDTTDPTTSVAVDAEGAFEALIAADVGDELRFQIRDGGDRLPPIDVLYTGGFEAPVRIPCLSIDLQTDFGSTAIGAAAPATLALDNTCPSDAEVTAPAFRIDPGPFAVVDAPTLVAAGTSATITAEFTPAAIGERERIVFVNVVVDGDPARYPVTLVGVGQ